MTRREFLKELIEDRSIILPIYSRFLSNRYWTKELTQIDKDNDETDRWIRDRYNL